MVNWTVRARRQLRIALAMAACWESHSVGRTVLESKMEQLDRILAQTFPDADSVVVQDKFLGFRPRANQHVLLVEVFGGERAGTYVVKIGPATKLEKEIAGWNSCRPIGLRSDLVFLPLQEGWRDPQPQSSDDAAMSLVYGDAQQFLGVETTSTLEAAMLCTILSGTPTVQSAGFVLVELYERIGHLLYPQSFVEDPATPDFVFSLHRLDDNLMRWDSEPAAVAVRRDAGAFADSGSGKYLDPVDYLRYVQGVVPWRADDGSVRSVAEGDAPIPAEVVPRLLRGCGHGDLHGRNVLVGIIHGRMLWPTVFDYEDMSPCNYPGWDFVKLEVELKMRAYMELFAGGRPSAFVRKVQQAEIALNEETERCHQARTWPAPLESQDGVERLRVLLLEVRRLASLHLGTDRGRPNDWLEEYYFLTACYGVGTVRFANLQPRERLAALLAAGVATARLSWPRRILDTSRPADDSEDGHLRASRQLSYHRLLRIAQKWIRAGNDAEKREAVALLNELRRAYPHALAIGQELGLALMECGRHDEAEQVLHELEGQFPNLDEETLCRAGRLYKEYGDRHTVAPADLNTAAAYYRSAIAKYDAAYQIRLGHYPGINKAALLHLLGTLDPATAQEERSAGFRRQSETVARELLARREQWPHDQPEDLTVWHPATEAEARLLLQEWQRAAALYRQVQQASGLTAHAIKSMRGQVERILHGFRNLGIAEMGPFSDLDALFPAKKA